MDTFTVTKTDLFAAEALGNDTNYLRLPVLPATVTRPAPTPRSEAEGEAAPARTDETSGLRTITPRVQDATSLEHRRPSEVYAVHSKIPDIITEAAEEYGVPVGLMLALAREENRQLDPEAIYETPQERSIGIYQMNVKGGIGIGHAEGDLMNPEYNAELAAQTIRREYERTGTWRGALWPWRGTRDAALKEWRGDHE